MVIDFVPLYKVSLIFFNNSHFSLQLDMKDSRGSNVSFHSDFTAPGCRSKYDTLRYYMQSVWPQVRNVVDSILTHTHGPTHRHERNVELMNIICLICFLCHRHVQIN